MTHLNILVISFTFLITVSCGESSGPDMPSLDDSVEATETEPAELVEPQSVIEPEVPLEQNESHISDWASWMYPTLDEIPNDGSVRFYSNPNSSLTLMLGTYEIDSGRRPWSSWWYPFNSDDLANARQGESPPRALEKFDEWQLEEFGAPGKASAYHLEKRYNPDAVKWAGLCTPRAFASALHEEPKRPALLHGICFGVEDLKAILLHTYEGVSADRWDGWYGQRNNNGPNDIYADIYPEQFHHLIVDQIGAQKKPLIIDHNAGSQVWSDVVYKVRTTIVKSEESPENAVDVTTLIFYPKYSLTPEELRESMVTASGAIPLVRRYTYRLCGSWESDVFTPSRGEWTERSILDHPDFVVVLPTDDFDIESLRKSFNTEVETSRVDTLLQAVRAAPECSPE